MSNRTESLLLGVKIDQSAAKKQAEELTVAIRKERNELVGLEKQFKAGEIAEKEYGAEKVRLTNSIKENSRQLTLNNNIAKAQAGSTKALEAQVTKLKDAYLKAVNPTKQEADAIKKMSDEVNKQKLEVGDSTSNIGKYTESILSAANNIPFLSGALANCQQAIVIAKASFGSFSGFLKSGFIGAVALAAAGITSFFKATGEGEDLLERITAKAKGLGAGIVQNLANATKAGRDAFADRNKGFIGLLKGAKDAVVSFDAYLTSDEAASAVRDSIKGYEGQVIALQNIEDAERQARVSASAYRLEIDRLLLTSKDLSLSDEEQIANLEKVKKLEVEMTAQQIQFAKVRLDNAKTAVKLVKDPTDAMLDAVADAQIALNELQGQSELVLQTANNRISTQLQQQQAKREAAAKVISDAIKAEAEYDFKTATDATTNKYKALDTLDLQHRLDSLQALNADEINRTKIQRDALEEQLVNLKKFGKDTADVENQIAQKNVEIARYNINEEIKLQNAKLQAFQSISTAIGGLSSLLNSTNAHSTEFAKGLALTQIYINEAIAISENVALATKAAAAGGPAAPFLIATYIATGLASIFAGIEQANQVLGQANTPSAPQFGGGGDFLTQGPQMIMVGDNPGGVERVTVEPLSGRGQSKVGRGANLLHLAGGGSVTAFGGGQFAQQTIINQVNNQAASNKQIVDGIQGRVPVLVVETEDRVRTNMQRVEVNSTI